LTLDPTGGRSLAHRVAQAVRDAPAGAQPAVLCSSSRARAILRGLTRSILPSIPVLSAPEIPDGIKVQAVGQVQ